MIDINGEGDELLWLHQLATLNNIALEDIEVSWGGLRCLYLIGVDIWATLRDKVLYCRILASIFLWYLYVLVFNGVDSSKFEFEVLVNDD